MSADGILIPHLRQALDVVRHPIMTSRNTRNNVEKKHIYILTLVVLTNCLTYFLLMPYSQKAANSHMNSGSFFGTTFYIISAISLILAINVTRKQNNIKIFLILLVLGGTCFYWGYKLHSVYCQGCANSG